MAALKIVALGTGSPIKIEAVTEAFGPSFTVVPVVDAQSGVPSQPVGDAETLLGAKNRALEARKSVPKATVCIGIENGMRGISGDENGPFEDVACVYAIWADGREMSAWSDALAIPSVLPFRKSRDGCWSELKDPHAVLTNGAKPRKVFLREAIDRLLAAAT